MNTGFDKLHLFSKDFIIKDTSIFGQNRNISQGKTEKDISIITIDKGSHMENIQANNIYFNHDLFNFSVNRLGAQILFNPSKILHPYELLSDINEVKRVTGRITDIMSKEGIKLNITDTSITRIDLAKQAVTDRSLYSYRYAFDFMRGKRLKTVRFEGGYRWGNNTHEVQIYDKGIESSLPFKNLNRLEAKFKKTKYIQAKTGLNKLNDLFQTDNGYINGIYKNYLINTIFDSQIKTQTVLDFNNEVQKLARFKEKGRNAVLNYLVASNIETLINKFGSIEVLFDMMKEVGFDKASISRQRKYIQEVLSYSCNNSTSNININVLINELKQKFAA